MKNLNNLTKAELINELNSLQGLQEKSILDIENELGRLDNLCRKSTQDIEDLEGTLMVQKDLKKTIEKLKEEHLNLNFEISSLKQSRDTINNRLSIKSQECKRLDDKVSKLSDENINLERRLARALGYIDRINEPDGLAQTGNMVAQIENKGPKVYEY